VHMSKAPGEWLNWWYLNILRSITYPHLHFSPAPFFVRQNFTNFNYELLMKFVRPFKLIFVFSLLIRWLEILKCSSQDTWSSIGSFKGLANNGHYLFLQENHERENIRTARLYDFVDITNDIFLIYEAYCFSNVVF
jgi:hypothetical protein